MVAVSQSQVSQVAAFAPQYAPLPFAPYMGYGVDAKTIAEQKEKAAEQLKSQSEAALQMTLAQLETQKSLTATTVEQKQAMAMASITAQRDQRLMALDQAYQQQRMALEQERAQKVAGVEQAALALGMQAQQARFMHGPVAGAVLPPALDEAAIAEQKERAAGLVEQQLGAVLERLTTQYEAQKELWSLEAQRALDLTTSSFTMQRDQGLAALEQQLQAQRFAVDQQRMQQSSVLEQTALTLSAQAEQARLQRSMQEQMMQSPMGFGMPTFAALPSVAYGAPVIRTQK